MGAELDLVFINCEVDETATKLEKFLPRVSVPLYCSTASSTVCLVRLFFSSKVATGKAVDEQSQV